MLQSSNKFAATAGVLTEFLPTLDQLTILRERFEGDEFGQKYAALAGGVRAAFTEMGVTEYTLAEGEPIDTSRMTVIESEHSAIIAKDCVLRPLAVGLELKGNIVRPAECVASLGVEETPEEGKKIVEEGEEDESPSVEASDESS